MTTRHLIDPEIVPVLDFLPDLDLSHDALPIMRAGMAAMERPGPVAIPDIRMIPGRDGAPDVPLHIFNADPAARPRPAILHIHGGGMVMGTADAASRSIGPMAEAMGFVAASVDYRLAPETAFPGPQEDCYAALAWLVAQADTLGIDPQRIVVLGESAGGGLAAALALMVRDRGDMALAGQMLIYPMLDHRTGGAECRWQSAGTGEFIWTRASNQFCWDALRGDYGCDDARKGWFSPALADDLAGLPPTYVAVGALDLFLDEDLDFVRRLAGAGVPVECHVYPGAIHAFDIVATARVAQQSRNDLTGAIRRMLALD
ncbi:MAG: alpha/beta hydrolase [Pseudomonadota bacterium]|uniref:Alpha/beta hydrolase n=1 Tax=Sphingobium xenophagum TaxID=121428 RepID=A0A249MUU2_SPHXE|nr:MULTISPECIES: alpha/beta hydrolase [Sphingobium]ASY45062.1 alpha/beta hydrolase [Sphingobium xenophagum]OUC54246.1 arylesterase [Sphingobium sp. GW456-12-10-14-TSB1]QWT14617.1 alpha/beta hydrolase [Sphingobium xenophagum]